MSTVTAFARVIFLSIATAFMGACSPEPESGGVDAHQAPPNILLILIDDMGFNDLGANGNGLVRTPRLDSLASQGIRFTRHYTDSTCTATRVGILTGMFPAASGFRPSNLGISPETLTLPDALRSGGYSTHHIGKWHLGYASELAWPLQQGFDTFFGFLDQTLLRSPGHAGNWNIGRPTYHDPWLQAQNNIPRQHRGHLSRLLAEHAVKFIGSQKNASQPWFLNYWTYAPHTPIQPMQEYASRYPATPEGRYLAFLEQVDNTVGLLLEALEENGLAEDTLVLVASDNGGTNRQVDNNAPFTGKKATFLEGGVRTPMILRWPGKIEPGKVFDEVVSNFDYFPTLVSAAGIELPGNLVGRDLLEIISGKVDRQAGLFWEVSNSELHSWSALSQNTRWRLVSDINGDATLSDFEQQPNGLVNVIEEYRDIADGLHGEFLDWRQAQRSIAVDYERLSDNGRARLRGQSLQRAPGYSGHTFAIALRPGPEQESVEHSGAGAPQVIAFQKDQWQLIRSGNRLQLEINNIRLEGPAPQGGECSTIVVTSHFEQSVIFPKARRVLVEMYLNGKKISEFQKAGSVLAPDNYLQPTYIGQDDQGGSLYQGWLGRPTLLNERLVAGDGGDLGNGISSLAELSCPGE